jgi:hypothetical protein
MVLHLPVCEYRFTRFCLSVPLLSYPMIAGIHVPCSWVPGPHVWRLTQVSGSTTASDFESPTIVVLPILAHPQPSISRKNVARKYHSPDTTTNNGCQNSNATLGDDGRLAAPMPLDRLCRPTASTNMCSNEGLTRDVMQGQS